MFKNKDLVKCKKDNRLGIVSHDGVGLTWKDTGKFHLDYGACAGWKDKPQLTEEYFELVERNCLKCDGKCHVKS